MLSFSTASSPQQRELMSSKQAATKYYTYIQIKTTLINFLIKVKLIKQNQITVAIKTLKTLFLPILLSINSFSLQKFS
jgi:hypothetical protein